MENEVVPEQDKVRSGQVAEGDWEAKGLLSGGKARWGRM